jgi:hypothetical protein
VPTPGQAQEIASLGSFALFVLITLFAGVALWRRWIVLGWFFDQERSGRLTAETQATRNVEALEATNTVLAGALKELASLRREMRGLRDEVRRSVVSRTPDG